MDNFIQYSLAYKKPIYKKLRHSLCAKKFRPVRNSFRTQILIVSYCSKNLQGGYIIDLKGQHFMDNLSEKRLRVISVTLLS